MSEPKNDQGFSDAALVEAFIIESSEFLELMDQDMVALESSPGDAETLNRIFRAMHTIKGTAGFLGFDPIVRLSHQAEDLLNAVRRGEAPANREVMDALLAAHDLLSKMLDDLRAGALGQYELGGVVGQLRSLLPGGAQSPHTLASQQATANPPKTQSDAAAPPAAQARPESKPPTAASQTIRVETRKLDELINLVGELVLERNRLVRIGNDAAAGRVSLSDAFAALAQATARLSFITEELQSAGLKTRMMPIETVFRKLPRLVRDVASQLNKQVTLVVRGEDTELDKSMVELIGDPLVHLVRNALDHGIEDPETRRKAGKPPAGVLRLEASQEGDQVVVSVSDDGCGIVPEKVGKKAVEKGLLSAERLGSLTRRELLDLIFLPGFSTAEQISEVSGRGVGMDVVCSNLKKLNGSVDIDSTPGVGTTLRLRLPLTLAILPVLLVQVAQETYALPLRSVVETTRLNPAHVHRLEGWEVLSLRDETLPLLRLAQVLRVSTQPLAGEIQSTIHGELGHKVVVLGVADRRLAVIVDGLLGQESTVVKPLGSGMKIDSTIAGATISADGRVVLVLDPAELASSSSAITPVSFARASA